MTARCAALPRTSFAAMHRPIEEPWKVSVAADSQPDELGSGLLRGATPLLQEPPGLPRDDEKRMPHQKQEDNEHWGYDSVLLVQAYERMLLMHQDNKRLAEENILLRQAYGTALTDPQRQMPQTSLDQPLQVAPGLDMNPFFGPAAHAKDSSEFLPWESPPCPPETKLAKKASRDFNGQCSSGDDSTLAGSARSAAQSLMSTNPSETESAKNEKSSKVILTTAMMRNLPNSCTRDMLVELLRDEGFGGKFDFVYLPIDFKSKAGLGYAFVNLVDPDVAKEFHSHFTGFSNWPLPSDKKSWVTWSTSAHGLQANIDRLRNSPVMHESVTDEHKPVIFVGSERVPIPPATKAIRPPRLWRRRR